jgi:hypothetical protein
MGCSFAQPSLPFMGMDGRAAARVGPRREARFAQALAPRFPTLAASPPVPPHKGEGGFIHHVAHSSSQDPPPLGGGGPRRRRGGGGGATPARLGVIDVLLRSPRTALPPPPCCAWSPAPKRGRILARRRAGRAMCECDRHQGAGGFTPCTTGAVLHPAGEQSRSAASSPGFAALRVSGLDPSARLRPGLGKIVGTICFQRKRPARRSDTTPILIQFSPRTSASSLEAKVSPEIMRSPEWSRTDGSTPKARRAAQRGVEAAGRLRSLPVKLREHHSLEREGGRR